MKIHSKSRGFTLIELMVVCAIIGILSAMVIVSLASAKAKARDGKRVSDLAQIQGALEQYFDHNNAYHSVNFRFLRYFPESGVEGGVECK